jgi:dTDP-4-amino-4,6-dideoxygalactose transaminase
LDELQGLPELVLPFVPADMDPVWHLFVVRHPRRDELQRHMAGAGIGTLIHYPVPPHLSGAYSALKQREGAYPVAENLSRTVLSLPLGPHLNKGAQHHVIAAIRSFR